MKLEKLSQNLLDELGMTPQMFTEMAAATDTKCECRAVTGGYSGAGK